MAVAVGTLWAIAAPTCAQAAIIDFENTDSSGAPFAPLLTDGDYVTQDGYYFQVLDPHNQGGAPDMSLVGSLTNGVDPGTCLDGVCPRGNATNYIAALNDGIVAFGLLSGGTSTLSRFDAAFLAPGGSAATALPAYLAIEGDRDDGSYAVGIFALGAVASDGTTAFQTFQTSNAQIISGTGTLISGNVTNWFAYAYYCGTGGSCTAFNSNKGQFALDNLALDGGGSIGGVPEAATWAMMILGLGGIGATLRRQRKGIPQAA